MGRALFEEKGRLLVTFLGLLEWPATSECLISNSDKREGGNMPCVHGWSITLNAGIILKKPFFWRQNTV